VALAAVAAPFCGSARASVSGDSAAASATQAAIADAVENLDANKKTARTQMMWKSWKVRLSPGERWANRTLPPAALPSLS